MNAMRRDYHVHKREITGEGLSQADVDASNAIMAAWKRPSLPPDDAREAKAPKASTTRKRFKRI